MSRNAATRPRVRDRFARKVEAIEILHAVHGDMLSDIPLGPVSLRRWEGIVEVNGRPIELYAWGSPNVFSDPSNEDLKARFELIVSNLKKPAQSENSLNSVLASQNGILLTKISELEDKIARIEHLLQLERDKTAALSVIAKKLHPLYAHRLPE